MDQSLYDNYVNILKHELVPALGCTEPIAIAFSAAKAAEVLGEFPDRIEMDCSGNIIKNVKGVTVPNSDGMKGIEAAAILGAVGGDAAKELEVLEEITPEHIEKAKELAARKICTCNLIDGVENLYITARVIKGERFAEVTIVSHHTNVVRIANISSDASDF